MTDQQTLFPTHHAGNDAPAGGSPLTTSIQTHRPPAPAPGPRSNPRACRLNKYDRKTHKRTLQYRILRWLANKGQITSTELNKAGSKDWHVQRSAGQRLRDCRSVFGLDLRRTTKGGITTWSLDIGDRIRAKELCDIAARRARRRR